MGLLLADIHEKPGVYMKFYRPKSILRLILTGFSLVALPLIIGLVYATISVDRLVSQSQHTLLQSVLANQGSQVLVDWIAKPGVARVFAKNWLLQVGGDSIGLFVALTTATGSMAMCVIPS